SHTIGFIESPGGPMRAVAAARGLWPSARSRFETVPSELGDTAIDSGVTLCPIENSWYSGWIPWSSITRRARRAATTGITSSGVPLHDKHALVLARLEVGQLLFVESPAHGDDAAQRLGCAKADVERHQPAL